jgi:hypothetical protein
VPPPELSVSHAVAPAALYEEAIAGGGSPLGA